MRVKIHSGTEGVGTSSEGLQRLRRPRGLSRGQLIEATDVEMAEMSCLNSYGAIVTKHLNHPTSFWGSVLQPSLERKVATARLLTMFGSRGVILAEPDRARVLARVCSKQGEAQHALGLCDVMRYLATCSPGSKGICKCLRHCGASPEVNNKNKSKCYL